MKRSDHSEIEALRVRIAELERELALERTARTRYEVAFEKCPIPLALIDGETHCYVAVNEATCDLYQRTPDELIGIDPCAMASGPIDGRSVRDIFSKKSAVLVRDGRVEFDGELAPFGEVLALHLQQCLTEVSGRKLIVSASTDVTARKDTEQMLARQTRQLEQTQELARIGGFEIEIATGKLFWTKELYRIMDAPEGYVPDLTQKYVADSSIGLVRALLYRCMTTGEPFDVDADVLDLKGRKLRARYMARAVIEDDRPVRVCCVIQDIEERSRIEDELLHKQKMESLGTLAGGLAHDVANVLMGIVAEATLLRRNMQADAPDQKRIDGILEATKRGAALTKQLLTYARKEPSELVPVALDDVVRRASTMLQRLVGECHYLSLELGDPGVVRIDPLQIEQVLMNMVTNARDAMPRGGVVTIATRRVGETAEITITDTGVGIADADLLRVFDPFFTTKPKDHGTGLGLSISYGIVKQNGGSIAVASELGKGTVFRIVLPCVGDTVQRDGTNESTASKLAEISSGLSILFVEDDAGIRKSLCAYLQEQGYDVVTAAHGGEANEAMRVRCRDFAVLITDVVMPYIGGVALAGLFRSEFPDVPIIYLTGYGEQQADLPVADWERRTFRLDKPFDPETLLGLLKQVLPPETPSRSG